MNPEQEPVKDNEKQEQHQIKQVSGSPSNSLIIAMNRLKQSQDRLYLVKQRLDILQFKQCRQFNKSMENERKSNFYMQISDFSEQEKVRKYRNLGYRQNQLQEMKRRNSQYRADYKDKRKEHRESLQQRNNEINIEMARQRKLNEKKIKLNRERQYRRKKSIRDQLYIAIKEGKEYVKQYKTNKKLNSILTKEEQKNQIQSRIQENEYYIKNIQQQTEQANQQLYQLIEQSRMKPQMQLSPSNNSKGFRVKYQSKNQTTLLLQ